MLPVLALLPLPCVGWKEMPRVLWLSTGGARLCDEPLALGATARLAEQCLGEEDLGFLPRGQSHDPCCSSPPSQHNPP